MSRELVVSTGGATAEEMHARMEARIQSAIDEATARYSAQPSPQIAELQGWWNLWAVGPVESGPPAFSPNQVIQAGQTATIYTILWLNPTYMIAPGISACEWISNCADRFEVKYCTGDLCSWQPAPAALQKKDSINIVPGKCWYLSSLTFTATAAMEGTYETNISARILGCKPGSTLHLAGFVSAVRDIDADTFYPSGPVPVGPTTGSPAPGRGPSWEFDNGIRFMIYP